MLRLALFLILPLAAAVLLILSPMWNPRLSATQQERAMAIRMTLFTWIMGAVLAVALILLPNKHRVLMLVPVFITAVVIGRVWKRARVRARAEREQQAVDLERMKRVN